MVLSWLRTFVIVAGNQEQMSAVSYAKSSSRRITVVEFVNKLKQLMQNFPNGLPVTNLASVYKVIYCSLLIF